jgi:hypothetical protein
MASNFRISINRGSEILYLNLIGDFDGSSAFELLNVLNKRFNGIFKVIIHTASLKDVHHFGVETFRRHLSELKGHQPSIIFTGKHAEQIAPEKWVVV